MKYLQIVLNIPLNQAFTYSITEEQISECKTELQVGLRAEIRFGNRKATGFITKILDSIPDNFPVPKEKIRTITRIIDSEPIFTPELYELAEWLSKYYLCSIGEALFSIIPSGRRETSAQGFSFDNEISDKTRPSLSAEQTKAVDEIVNSARNEKSSYHYLYGPTGTGKTEVFLQAAEWLLNAGKGVIYLVPEIGLTPQVIKAVTERFGDTAAVLHSGLTPSQRLGQWKKIMHKEARIVIGARSAVFAPVPDLGMIIIDEEHDGSYKSGTTPRYHARQAAMHRCSRLNIPLVMGSATPSVEAWHLMNSQKLIRHTLTQRLAGGAMPSIKTIDLSKTANNGCISEELEKEIRTTIENKKQSILFLNRRGFTHFFRCNTCGFEMKCKNCSVPMTFHKNENRLRCHYCGWSTVPPQFCPQCSSLDVGYSGFGTEYIESETQAKFPNARIVRIDTDALTKKGELQEKLDAFRRGDFDIMLGTQMVAKGLNFPNLQLVGVILADTGLHMPDFRAGERTFSLITQVAGRAGRYFPDGKVFVQTYNPYREPIKYACTSQVSDFYQFELTQRKILGFPPFSRLLRLVFRSANQALAYKTSCQASEILQELLNQKADVIGPAECPIAKISQNFRFHVILKSNNISIMQQAVNNLLNNYNHPQQVYIECDVDPISLL
ncbi:MAG: primosomal protein N' [Treponema sp.]|nr:primosomal protein N' [Treponema sp.]